MLLTDHDKHSWIFFADPLEGLVVRERQADEHDVVELATEKVVEVVHDEPGFAVGPTTKTLKGMLSGFIAAPASSMLDRF